MSGTPTMNDCGVDTVVDTMPILMRAHTRAKWQGKKNGKKHKWNEICILSKNKLTELSLFRSGAIWRPVAYTRLRISICAKMKIKTNRNRSWAEKTLRNASPRTYDSNVNCWLDDE